MNMIYTIGNKNGYEEAFEKLKPIHPQKLGRNQTIDQDDADVTYPGGAVWRTREEAQAYIDSNGKGNEYSVYGVDAQWERDTYNNGKPWNNLLHSAWLNRLEQE